LGLYTLLSIVYVQNCLLHFVLMYGFLYEDLIHLEIRKMAFAWMVDDIPSFNC